MDNQNKEVNVSTSMMLLEYKKMLQQQIKDKRAEACRLAAQVRQIDKLVTPELKEEIANTVKTIETWSVKSTDELMEQFKLVKGK